MAMEGLQLDQLERELQQMKAHLDTWALRQQTMAHDIKDQHAGSMKEQSGRVQSLRQSRQQLVAAVEQLRARLANEQQQLDSLHATSATVGSEQEVLQRQLKALQDALQMQETDCVRLESDVMVEQKKREKIASALKQGIAKYATNLGLEFRQGAEDLELVMTQIDPKAPQREFKVAVCIQKDNTYKVTRCVPEVDRLPELLTELNTKYSFSDFIAALRKEFQHLAEAA